MVFENFRKSCICVSAFCLSFSLPLWSFADTATPKQTAPGSTTYATSVSEPPNPTELSTTITNTPAGVSNKSHTFEKQSSIKINDHTIMLSGSVSLGLLNGKSKETVYTPDTGHKNSELIWHLDNVAMLGFGGSVKPLSWLGFNGNVWVKVNNGDGYIDNYDWRATNYDDWTDWSHSPTKVTEGILYDINMELTILRFRGTSFFGILGFKHDHWKWEAHGGTYIYSMDSLRDTFDSFPDDVTVLTYEQTYDVPYLGIGVHSNWEPITISARFIASSMVKAKDEDQHPLRDLQVTSSLDNGNIYGIDFACTYNFTPNIAVTATFQHTKYKELKGSKDWDFYSEGEQFQYDGGMSNESNLFYLSLLFTL